MVLGARVRSVLSLVSLVVTVLAELEEYPECPSLIILSAHVLAAPDLLLVRRRRRRAVICAHSILFARQCDTYWTWLLFLLPPTLRCVGVKASSPAGLNLNQSSYFGA